MKRVLIVDDEPMILRILRVALEEKGYQVDSANNGEQALLMVDKVMPDVVVTDIDMPRMNGRQLCVALREKHCSASLPIFVVTAKTAVEHRDWSRVIENLHFLEKPVSIRKLCMRLELEFAKNAETEGCPS